MDGPISTYETAGQRAAYAPFRRPSVGPPEKVPPVSEGRRSHSSVRDETDPPDSTNRNPAARDRKTEVGRPEETQAPPYFLELGPGVKEASGTGMQTGSSEDAPPSPPSRVTLAEALAAAKARWAEVNEEALEANPLPDPSLPDPARDETPAGGWDITGTRHASSTTDGGFASKMPNPTAPSGKASPEAEMAGDLRHRLTTRYQNLATSLSSPHPTQPLIDVFV